MMNLTRVFEVWFLTPEFSLSELKDFAEDTLSKLTANNPGNVFDIIIATLDTALSGLSGTRGQRASATSIRESRTRATEQLLAQLHATIKRRQGRVVDNFGKGSPEYQAFYPQGLAGYNKMAYTEVETRLDVLIGAAVTHLPALTAEFTAMKTQWMDVRGTQVDQKGAVSAGMDAEREARKQLARALMKAVLFVAYEFTGEEAKAAIYFNQSLLYNPQAAGNEPTVSPTSAVPS